MPETAIEQKVSVTPAYVPDIAAKEGLDPRLVNQGNAVTHPDGFVPIRFGDDFKLRQGLASGRREREGRPGQGRR